MSNAKTVEMTDAQIVDASESEGVLRCDRCNKNLIGKAGGIFKTRGMVSGKGCAKHISEQGGLTDLKPAERKTAVKDAYLSDLREKILAGIARKAAKGGK